MWSLLAQAARRVDRRTVLESMRSGFDDKGWSYESTVLVGLLASALLLVLLFGLMQRRRDAAQAPVRRRRDLLGKLASVAGLSGVELRDIERVARAATWPNPATLLLSPANLAAGVQAAGAAVDSAAKARLQRLAARLFGVSMTFDAAH